MTRKTLGVMSVTCLAIGSAWLILPPFRNVLAGCNASNGIQYGVTIDPLPPVLLAVGTTGTLTARNALNHPGTYKWTVAPTTKVTPLSWTEMNVSQSTLTLTGVQVSGSANDVSVSVEFIPNPSDSGTCGAQTNLTVVKVELRYEVSTKWLVIEDQNSPGAGDDVASKPVQRAENTANIVYAILPTGAPNPTAVTLEIPGTTYIKHLPLATGVQLALIETKNGKLKLDSGPSAWLPSTTLGCFPPNDYRLHLTAVFTPLLTCTDDYQSSEYLTIAPLMAELSFTPDLPSGKTLCPYWDPLTIGSTKGFGLDIKYDLWDVLANLDVEVVGGDITTSKSITTSAANRAVGIDKHGKWEGYDAQIAEQFDAIVQYPNQMIPPSKGPEHVVKEGDDYVLTLDMSRDVDPTQTQSFSIPLTVEYKTKNK